MNIIIYNILHYVIMICSPLETAFDGHILPTTVKSCVEQRRLYFFLCVMVLSAELYSLLYMHCIIVHNISIEVHIVRTTLECLMDEQKLKKKQTRRSYIICTQITVLSRR